MSRGGYQAASFPPELLALDQWVTYALVERGWKLTKVPLQCDGRAASSTDPRTWTSYAAVDAHCRAQDHRRRGFVFTADDPWGGLDFDHCRHAGPLDEGIAAWLFPWLDRLGGYTEWSPSGEGIHVIGRFTIGKGRRGPGIEAYDRGRFFTMTGNTIPAWAMFGRNPLRDSQAVVEALLAARCPAPAPPARAAPTYLPPWNLDTILSRAMRAANGRRVLALFNGGQLDYESASEGDLALLCMLAFWTREAGQLDALFRRSHRMRAKWDSQHGAQTYGALTIAAALAHGAAYRGPDGGHPPIWQTYPA